MGEKSRANFIVVIALILAAAVIYSFAANYFSETPDVGFAELDPSPSSGPAGQDPAGDMVRVEVTPESVQSVIGTLNRYSSYRRTVIVEYLAGGEVLTTLTAEVAVDGGWTRCDLTQPDGRTQHSIVGDGVCWMWYDSQSTYAQIPAEEGAADLAQRLPTYEDVLALDRRSITEASYVLLNELPCVYVEVDQRELGYVERFWVSVESGLLAASESVKNGETVYRMSSFEVLSPASNLQDSFTLPDGTVLHRAAG